jgi:hypothetical protein
MKAARTFLLVIALTLAFASDALSFGVTALAGVG